MELLKKYPKTFQWLFLLVVFFALCFAIEVPETYKFIRGQAEFVKDPNQSSYVFLGKEVRFMLLMSSGGYLHCLDGYQFGLMTHYFF